MTKTTINQQTAKKYFTESVYKTLRKQLVENGNQAYEDMFELKDGQILATLPPDFFNLYNIPENTKIAISFTVKRS